MATGAAGTPDEPRGGLPGLAETGRQPVPGLCRLLLRRAPGSLSPELRADLGQHRDELIELLIAERRRNQQSRRKEVPPVSEKHAGIIW